MNRGLALMLFLLTSFGLHAQYAESFVPMVLQDQIGRDEALWLAGSASGSLPVGSAISESTRLLERLAPDVLLAMQPDDPVTVGQFAQLLLSLEETPSGFWYALFPSPYTAYEQFLSLKLIDRDISSSTSIDGRQAVIMTRRYLEYAALVSAMPGEEQ